MQFGIKRVIVGESLTFPGAAAFLRTHQVEVIDLSLPDCVQLMADFIAQCPALWSEDIGTL